MGDDEVGSARAVDITVDDDGDERFPRPDALPWTAAWALVSSGLLLLAFTGAGILQSALTFLEEGSSFTTRWASVTASSTPLALSLLAGAAGQVALRRPDDAERRWVRPLALATSLIAALTAAIFLAALIVALAKGASTGPGE